MHTRMPKSRPEDGLGGGTPFALLLQGYALKDGPSRHGPHGFGATRDTNALVEAPGRRAAMSPNDNIHELEAEIENRKRDLSEDAAQISGKIEEVRATVSPTMWANDSHSSRRVQPCCWVLPMDIL